MNYRMIATRVGDLLKWDVSVKEIDRVAMAMFRFNKESFPNAAISSTRAQLVFEWILSLGKQKMNPDERNKLLYQFCIQIAPEDHKEAVLKILTENGFSLNQVNREELNQFLSRNFHPEVVLHCKDLFVQGNYFHSIFEASKAYNLAIKTKANSIKDGQSLMLDVLSAANGVLKYTACRTETERNVQEGIKFLSAGLVQTIRNPTAHEPAVTFTIDRQDCLDILSLISFLFRKLDTAVYIQPFQNSKH